MNDTFNWSPERQYKWNSEHIHDECKQLDFKSLVLLTSDIEQCRIHSLLWMSKPKEITWISAAVEKKAIKEQRINNLGLKQKLNFILKSNS